MLAAQRLESSELGRGIARRHVGDAFEIQRFDLSHQQLEEIILELLGLLVSGWRFADITQIRIHRDRTDLVAEGHRSRHRHTFLTARLDEDALKKRTFEHADQIIDVVRIRRVGEQAGEFGRHRDAELITQAGDQSRAGTVPISQLASERIHQMPLGDAALFGSQTVGQDIRFEIQRLDTERKQHGIESIKHGAIPHIAGGEDRSKKGLGRSESPARQAVQGNVADLNRIRIVEFASG